MDLTLHRECTFVLLSDMLHNSLIVPAVKETFFVSVKDQFVWVIIMFKYNDISNDQTSFVFMGRLISSSGNNNKSYNGRNRETSHTDLYILRETSANTTSDLYRPVFKDTSDVTLFNLIQEYIQFHLCIHHKWNFYIFLGKHVNVSRLAECTVIEESHVCACKIFDSVILNYKYALFT